MGESKRHWRALAIELAAFGAVLVASVTSGLFAVVHGELVFMPVIFVGGVLLAELRRRSGGLVAPMIVHAINNGAATWALYHGV